MKYELLKRTAISLFICGIVAGNALAESESNSYKKFLSYDKVDSYNNTQALRGIKVGDDLANIDTEGNIKVTKANQADIDKDPFKGKGLIAVVADNKSQTTLISATAYNNAQVLNGFKKGDDIFELDNNGNVKKRSATEDDVTKDDLEGKGVVATVIKNKDSIEDLSEDLAVTDDKVKELADHVKKNQEELNEAAGAVKDLQDGVSDLHEVVYGPEGKPEEGLVDIVTKHTDAIYGTDDNPGLMEVVRKQTEAINDLKAYNSLDDVKALVANKADKTDVDANKAEIAKKANESDVYTKIESDSKLDAKANASDVYTKTESDSKLNAKANVADVYSKTETDNKFALKADNSVVSAQAADISNLRTDVNAHTKRLDHLDNRVNKLDKDLKRGLAAQAALTGLFQPYTVGKANFTAAVGGYKSQTAVAIGTGYRYTQNIATKAGVAFTQGGGVTYNAGVNFEW